jgi:PII-like signaling protein
MLLGAKVPVVVEVVRENESIPRDKYKLDSHELFETPLRSANRFVGSPSSR